METTVNLRNTRGFLMQVYLITLSTCVLITILLLVFSPSYKVFIFGIQSAFLGASAYNIKHSKGLKFLSHNYVVSCYVTLIVYASCTGGIVAPGIVWFMICPLISDITLSRKVAIFWLYIVLATFLAFILFQQQLVFDNFGGGNGWYFLSYTLFLITIFRLLNIFLRILEKRTAELNIVNVSMRESQYRLMEYQKAIEGQNRQIRYKNFELQRQKLEAVKRSETLEHYLNEMIDISRMEELHGGDLRYSIEVLHNTLLSTLNLSRVSIWEFDAQNPGLNIKGALCESIDVHKPVITKIEKYQCPKSFELLEAGALLNINDTENSRHVAELRRHIDIEYIFKSALVCPYFIDGRFAGVIDCETLTKRNWSTEEIMFVRAMADTLSLSYKSYERKKQEVLLQEKQQYIQEINQLLEQKVVSRTAELESKNKQLMQYAFMNSHEIRGPICRLLGLKHLLNKSNLRHEILEIKAYMENSIDELNDITIRAGKILEENLPNASSTSFL